MTTGELAIKLTALAANGNCSEMRQLQKEFPQVFGEAIRTKKFQWAFGSSVIEYDRDTIATFVELGVDLNRHDNEGFAESGTYPLNECLYENKPDHVRILLELGTDPNLVNGLNSLSYINVDPETQIAMAKLLIEFGADVNLEYKNIPGYTPLCRALEKGHGELAEFLISKGAVMPELEETQVPVLNLDTFQERLESVCRQCWHDVTDKFPDEKFCLFGLETDSEFVILSPLLDSEGAVDRDKENRLLSSSFVGRISLDSDAEFYGEGRELFDELSSELNSRFGVDETQRERSKRIKTLLGIFGSALKTLDQEGLFGSGPDRERIILLVSIIDADKAEWKTMLKTAKRLNPSTVFKQFRSSLRIIG